MLNDALSPNRPWLIAYRAAEALGQSAMGEPPGRCSMRYVTRTAMFAGAPCAPWQLLATRARYWSYGGSPATIRVRPAGRVGYGGAAQSVLDQMQSRNMLLRGADRGGGASRA